MRRAGSAPALCVLLSVWSVAALGAETGVHQSSHSLLSAVLGWFHVGSGGLGSVLGPVSPEQPHIAAHQPQARFIMGAGAESHPQMQHERMMMHRSEADLVASYLKKGDTYVEWGLGGSTFSFVPLVSRAFAIEHDCEWRDYVVRQLNESDTDYSHLTTICPGVPMGTDGWGTISSFEHAQYRGPFQPYVDAIAGLGVPKFDAVFVDGRARMACALRALEYMHDGSVLFIHDFFTRNMHYSGALEYFDEVARVLAFENRDPRAGPVDEPQGLVVLRKKPGAPMSLTADQINAKYDAISWRFPYGPPLNTLSGLWDYYVVASLNLSRWHRARNAVNLVENVRGDMARIVFLYLIALAIRRFKKDPPKWSLRAVGSRDKSGRKFMRSSESRKPRSLPGERESASQGTVVDAVLQGAPNKSIPKASNFMETTATQRATVRRNASDTRI